MATRAYLYRENFPWGKTDGYTDGRGGFGFVEWHHGRRRYYTPQRMARKLSRTWCPPWGWNTLQRVANECDTAIHQLQALKAL